MKPLGLEWDRAQDKVIKHWNAFIPRDHTHTSPPCESLTALTHAPNPSLPSWSPVLPKPSAKLLGIFPDPSPAPLPLRGQDAAWGGDRNPSQRPSQRAGRCPRLATALMPPRDAPGQGCGAEGSLLLILASSRRLPQRSGDAELGRVCPAPARGTELGVTRRAGAFQGGSAGAEPAADAAHEAAEDGGAEDDENPGVHDGVDGEEAQRAQVGVLVEISSKGSHVGPDLAKKTSREWEKVREGQGNRGKLREVLLGWG